MPPAPESPAASPLSRLLAALGALGVHHRVRLAMLLALLLGMAVVGLGLFAAEQLDRQHRADAETIHLAARQRMWSQRIAQLVPQLQNPAALRALAEERLQLALAESQLEGLRLAALVDAQAEAAAATLAPVLAAWHNARERVAYRAEVVLRLLAEPQTDGERLHGALLALQAEMEPAQAAVQLLADQSGAAARERSEAALRNLRLAALLLGGLLVALVLAVAEPTARAVRRQTRQLEVQAGELARLALVAERTHLAVTLTDAKGRAIWVNEAFSRITGLAEVDILGHNPVRLLQAVSTQPALVRPIRRAMNAGQGARGELPSRTRDGHEYWLDLDLQPWHEAGGALGGFVGVANDITERVSQRLKTAAMLAALPAGVLVQDEQGAIVEFNPAAERVLGLSREQLLRREALPQGFRVVREDLSECTMADSPGARALRSGQGLRDETYGVADGDGGLRWLLVNAEPIVDAFGRTAGAVTCLTDVTEQRNQRVLLQMTVDAAGVGTWQWDMRSNLLHCNPRFMTMLGYRPDAGGLDQVALGSLIHPEDIDRRREALRQHLRNPAVPFRFEQRLRRPDGEWATVLSCGTVIERSEDGRARRMAGLHFDLTEQMQMQAMLRHAARTDGLTQLPNRAAVFDRVQQVLQRAAQQPDAGYAVLFMDFDRFKQVNDTLGHAVGDELLRQIAQRLRATLRAGDAIGRSAAYDPGRSAAYDPGRSAAYDPGRSAPGESGPGAACEHTAGRIGGDEFVVVLEGVRDREQACAAARRLLEALSAPYQIGPHVVHSTASIGIVTAEQAANDAHTVMRDADTAMYEAKRSGRGRYVVFDPSMHERVARSLGLENDLRLALRRDELFVVYQPVVEFNDARAGAVEALARWRHPTRGLVPPTEFIPVAEDSGLIVDIGRRVLGAACRQFVAWQRQLGSRAPGSIAVNLSPVQLRHPGLLDEVRTCLRSTGIAPHCLQLEVTESLAAQDELARERLQELKALGLRIALDDFGTGYSSLACLHQLPVDTVKIDRSFVAYAETSEYHRALIEATIRVAQTLGMTTVAEGIETAGQAALMRQLQCARGQGFLYSTPLEAEALVQWLHRRAEERRRDAA